MKGHENAQRSFEGAKNGGHIESRTSVSSRPYLVSKSTEAYFDQPIPKPTTDLGFRGISHKRTSDSFASRSRPRTLGRRSN